MIGKMDSTTEQLVTVSVRVSGRYYAVSCLYYYKLLKPTVKKISLSLCIISKGSHMENVLIKPHLKTGTVKFNRL